MRSSSAAERAVVPLSHESQPEQIRGTNEAAATALRIVLFFLLIAALAWGLDTTITRGLRRMSTSLYGVSNLIMDGKVNAQIVITGSSRAASHFDPRIIQKITGYRTFNLGRNGSQTDMQLAVFKFYLKHNRKPAVVIHNLDAFTFQTSHEVYNSAQYVPYLSEEELYQSLRQVNANIWKSRYLPLYGYIVEDMSFAWLQGLKAWLPLPQREEIIDGYDPRPTPWTDEFRHFQATHPSGVRWEVEAEGKRLLEELTRICQEQGIRLILVYSPEYAEMQALTTNRAEVFDEFRKIAAKRQVPLWDYSNWRSRSDTRYFTNSQHLNADGARVFSTEFAAELSKYMGMETSGAQGGLVNGAGGSMVSVAQ